LGLLSIPMLSFAAEPVRIDFSGEPGAYGVAQWRKDWPGCQFASREAAELRYTVRFDEAFDFSCRVCAGGQRPSRVVTRSRAERGFRCG